MILEMKDVWKKYSQPGGQELQVLKGCSLTIEKGETVAITGQSGSGKSTLLSLLAGLDIADRGTIEIDSTELSGLDEASLTRFRGKRIGVVFQQFHLMPHLSAVENVRLPMELHGLSEAKEKTDMLMEQVGLQDRRNHRPRQLSGGECQRVAIARALVTEPALLLADEPTGNLDIKTGELVGELLFNLVSSWGMTMVIVTHNNDLASRCGRSLQLLSGNFT